MVSDNTDPDTPHTGAIPVISGGPSAAGTAPSNIVNRTRTEAGVQIELSHKLCVRLFAGLDRHERAQPTESFHRFVRVVRAVLTTSNKER